MSSADENSRRRRVTYRQLEALWKILNSHKDLAVGYNKTSQAREYSQRMWESVAENLNSLGEGAVKNSKGWSCYWVDYKAKLKKRVATVRASRNRTGGGPPNVTPLNEIEQKFLDILGEDFGVGLPNTQMPLFPILIPSSSGENVHVYGESEADPSPHQAPPSPVPPLVISPPVDINSSRRARQRRRIGHLTQEAYRRRLANNATERLVLARRNTEIWEQVLPLLNRIADSLERLFSVY